MDDLRFSIHRRALPAYHEINRAERSALEAALAPLVNRPERQWPQAGATRLESADPLYLVRVDKSLRAIIRPTAGGQPEVLDLVRHETLERFFRGSDSPAAHA
jgi:hypothetical protein